MLPSQLNSRLGFINPGLTLTQRGTFGRGCCGALREAAAALGSSWRLPVGAKWGKSMRLFMENSSIKMVFNYFNMGFIGIRMEWNMNGTFMGYQWPSCIFSPGDPPFSRIFLHQNPSKTHKWCPKFRWFFLEASRSVPPRKPAILVRINSGASMFPK